MWWSLRRLALLVFLLLFALPNGDARKCAHALKTGNNTSYKDGKGLDLAKFTEDDVEERVCGDNIELCAAGIMRTMYGADVTWYTGCLKGLSKEYQDAWKGKTEDTFVIQNDAVFYLCKEYDCREKFFREFSERVQTGNTEIKGLAYGKEIKTMPTCNVHNAKVGKEKIDLQKVGTSTPAKKHCQEHCVAALCPSDDDDEMQWVEGCPHDVKKKCNLDAGTKMEPNNCFVDQNKVVKGYTCDKSNCRNGLFYCLLLNGNIPGKQKIDKDAFYDKFHGNLIKFPYDGMNKPEQQCSAA